MADMPVILNTGNILAICRFHVYQVMLGISIILFSLDYPTVTAFIFSPLIYECFYVNIAKRILTVLTSHIND